MLFLVAGAVTAFAAGFLKLADSVRESEVVVRVDHRVLDFVSAHRVGWVSRGARWVTLLGSGSVVAVVVAVAVVVLVLRRRPFDALFVALSSTGAAVLVEVVKNVVGRPRPASSARLVSASGAAFPSGHAAQSIACYAALAVVVAAGARSRRSRPLVVLAAATIGLTVGGSRVYLGVHWASDVVSGWLLAAGWLLALVGVRFAMQGSAADEEAGVPGGS
ncbi:MAG TPA: phosphatase PAP2 family protein [Acidimicrobiia bacterium]